MPQRVLLASRTPETLQAVRDGLEAGGHHVQTADEFEAVVGIARAHSVDLVIIAESLNGGTGSDVCMVLERLPGHAPLLYVGDTLVPGADASAPEDDPGRILEQAMVLLEGAALIDSLGDVQNEAAKDADNEDEEDAAGDDAEDVPVTRKSPAVPPPAATNGSVAKAEAPAPRRDKDFLEQLLRAVREADYFEILGIPVEATAEEVKAAHASLRASLVELAAPRAQLEEAQAALDEARDVLTEPALRAAYTRNRL